MNTQNPNWHRAGFTVLPPPIVGGSLMLNPKNKTLMLVGGINPKESRPNGLWATNEQRWEQAQTDILPIGSYMSAAWDDDQQTAVIFGGINSSGKIMGNTWSFDGDQWLQQQPISSPVARANACMAYDTMQKVVMLFGGETPTERFSVLINDTWMWDGFNWRQIFPDPSPIPRIGAKMIYDSIRQAIVLFGGCSGGGYLDDTWIWDGSTWNQQQPFPHPAARAYAGMTYDPEGQQVVLFGGQSFEGVLNDTWLWDGQNWLQLQPKNSPPPEAGYCPHLIYDPVRKKVMLYSVIQNKTDHPDEFTAYSELWTLVY